MTEDLVAQPALYSIPKPGQTLHGFSRDQIYKMLRDGEIRACKHGKRSLICADSLHRKIASLPDYVAPSASSSEARPSNCISVLAARLSERPAAHPAALTVEPVAPQRRPRGRPKKSPLVEVRAAQPRNRSPQPAE